MTEAAAFKAHYMRSQIRPCRYLELHSQAGGSLQLMKGKWPPNAGTVGPDLRGLPSGGSRSVDGKRRFANISLMRMSLYVCKHPPTEPLDFWCQGVCEHRPRICSVCRRHNGLGKTRRWEQLTGQQLWDWKCSGNCEGSACQPSMVPLVADAELCCYPSKPRILVPEEDLPDEYPVSAVSDEENLAPWEVDPDATPFWM